MRLFPLFADLRERAVLVVGGGDVAVRKVNSLLASGAAVTVGAERIDRRLRLLAQCGTLRLIEGAFDDPWLDGQWLVVAATDDHALNGRIAAAAEARRLFCNAVDDPARCSVQMPAVVDRAPLMIAVSSGGSAPALARRVRARIEALVGHAIGELCALAERHRPAIQRAHPDLGARRRFYDWLLDGPVLQALTQRRAVEADAALAAALADEVEAAGAGRVTLVGAGSGDPGLLTLAGLRALQSADVILHDRLVSAEVLDLARRDADRVSVGKRPGEDHEATQSRIHRLMVAHARAGRRVVRLKGGDVFVFGRGGEELEYLAAHGVAYDVVPGVTAALACAAYAGVPLTHRDHAQSVRLVTAQRRQPMSDAEWADLARPGQTLAFYMGVGDLDWLAGRLMAHGCPPERPYALVENGTQRRQRVVYGTLRTLAAQAAEHGIGAPAMLLVGDVAGLGPELAWFGEAGAVPRETEAVATL